MPVGYTESVIATNEAAGRRDPYSAYRPLLSPERVRELSIIQPRRSIKDTASCWGAIAASWAAAFFWPRWWVVLAGMVVVGARYYALFIIGHDGFHQRLFRNQRLNDLFTDVCLVGPIGAVTHLNKRNHLAHHRLLANSADPDRHKHICGNKTERIELTLYLAGLGSVILAIHHVFFARDRAARESTSSADDHYTIRDLLILAGWQLALIAGLTALFGWWGYLLLWLAPLYLFTFLADNLRSFVEHSQLMADDEADAHRLVTYTSNSIERFFIAPMNMNYHATHHLWPSIPYYNLAIADRELRQAGPTGIEWRRSYLAYVWQYWRALPFAQCRKQSAMST